MNKIEIGRAGEMLARVYLEESGYEILAQNHRTFLGELDFVAKKDGTIVFVEVRTRTSTTYGTPQESVDFAKQKRLIRLALQFCAQHNLYSNDLRFDVIAVMLHKDQEKINHIPNAFMVRGDY